MRVFSLSLALSLAVLLFLVGFATHRVRLFLYRENGVFRVDFRFLFYKRPLYDSRFPIEAKKVTKKNLPKKLSRLMQKKRTVRRETPFREFLFYSRMGILLFLALGEENIPRLRIYLHRFRLFLGSDEPSRSAILCGSAYAGFSHVLALLDKISHVECDVDAFSVSMLGERYFETEFDVELSLPLIYYFQVFHCIIPDSERVLTVLKKRRKKLQLRRKKQNALRRKSHVGKQFV